MMVDRFSTSMVAVVIAAAAVSTAISVPATRTSAQAPAVSTTALKTPWGEPDLQGIWTEEFDTPLQPGCFQRAVVCDAALRSYSAANGRANLRGEQPAVLHDPDSEQAGFLSGAGARRSQPHSGRHHWAFLRALCVTNFRWAQTGPPWKYEKRSVCQINLGAKYASVKVGRTNAWLLNSKGVSN